MGDCGQPAHSQLIYGILHRGGTSLTVHDGLRWYRTSVRDSEGKYVFTSWLPPRSHFYIVRFRAAKTAAEECPERSRRETCSGRPSRLTAVSGCTGKHPLVPLGSCERCRTAIKCVGYGRGTERILVWPCPEKHIRRQRRVLDRDHLTALNRGLVPGARAQYFPAVSPILSSATYLRQWTRTILCLVLWLSL